MCFALTWYRLLDFTENNSSPKKKKKKKPLEILKIFFKYGPTNDNI